MIPFRASDVSCPREGEVLDLIAIGQWPERAEADLRSHASGCAVCGDLATAASAVIALRDATAAAPLPDASVVWGRAHLRAREEALRRVAQPFHLAVGVAAAAVAGLGLAWWGFGAAWARQWWGWLTGLVPEATVSLQALPVQALPDGLPSLTTMIAVVAISVLAVPVAFYFAER